MTSIFIKRKTETYNDAERALSVIRAFILISLSYSGFGSALNIETLLAAAERRDPPIEVAIPYIFAY